MKIATIPQWFSKIGHAGAFRWASFLERQATGTRPPLAFATAS